MSQTCIPFSRISADTRAPDSIIAFGSNGERRWAPFLAHVASIRVALREDRRKRWLLNADDPYYFLCALVALLQSGCEAVLSANVGSGILDEVLDAETGYLSDSAVARALSIPDLLATQKGADSECSFPPIDPETARITLYTSGSTGKAMACPKRLLELETEIAELSALWADDLDGRRMYATVNHHHIYGLLFAILLPYSLGLPFANELIAYPEGLEGLVAEDAAVVSSPAFLKRVAESDMAKGAEAPAPIVFSSGGTLPQAVSQAVKDKTGISIREIYGSTETGGVAYRRSPEERDWLPFPRNTVSFDIEGRISVRSPYIIDPDGFRTGDVGLMSPSGRFLIEGRADSIVKIEEKRISLREVEARLLESPLLADAHVIAMEEGRQFLAAVLVLSEAGFDRFRVSGKRELDHFFREHASRYLEATVVPKRWRYTDRIPRDHQDKIRRADIEALFMARKGLEVFSCIKSGDSARLELRIGQESPFFDGHFPEYKLLPGVAQLDLAMRFADERLGTGPRIRSIPRIKFQRPIAPGSRLILELTFKRENRRLIFAFKDAHDSGGYSSGTIELEDA